MSTPINWPNWIARTHEIEYAVWAHHSAFEERFCRGEEMIKLRLASETFEFVYMTGEGQHIVDGAPLSDLIEFLANTPESEAFNG